MSSDGAHPRDGTVRETDAHPRDGTVRETAHARHGQGDQAAKAIAGRFVSAPAPVRTVKPQAGPDAPAPASAPVRAGG